MHTNETPTRCTLGATLSLLLTAGALDAQEREVLHTEGAVLTQFDRFGQVITGGIPGLPLGFLDVGLDGRIAFVRDAAPRVVARQFGSVQQPNLSLSSGSIAGLCFDTDGELLVLDSFGLVRRSSQNQLLTLVPVPPIGTAERLVAGRAGSAYGIVRGSTDDSLFRYGPQAPRMQVFQTRTGFGRVADLIVRDSGTAEQVVVASEDIAELLILENNAPVQQIDLSSFTNGLLQVFAISGDELAVVTRQNDLLRVDPANGTAEVIQVPGLVRSGAADAEGRIWVVLETSPTSEVLHRVDLLVANAISVPLGTRLDRASVFPAAAGAFGPSDRDGDGATDREEALAGSHPLDPQSTPILDFDLQPLGRSGTPARFEIEGVAAPGALVVSNTASPPLPLQGVIGDVLLGAPFLVTVPLAVPASFTPRLPPQSMGGPLFGQVLAGTPALGLRLSDREEVRWSMAQQVSIVEDFTVDTRRDPLRSSGSWGGGRAQPAQVGGAGALGSFDPSVGVEVEPSVFVFNSDVQSFPGSVTASGQPMTVTDGVFEFTDFVIPAGVRVRFEGSQPVVLKVTGDVQIDGVLDLSAVDLDPFTSVIPLPGNQRGFTAGQPGGAPGAGGAPGGKGGDSADGTGANPAFLGQPGGDLRVAPSSGFGPSAANSGGNVSPLYPTGGVAIPSMFPSQLGSFTLSFGTVSIHAPGGGAGGAFLSDGLDGLYASSTFSQRPAPEWGPDTPGPMAVPLVLPPAGVTSLDHFLVGGAGGGGGASGIFGARSQQVIGIGSAWNAGAAGGGGGGALAMRIGGDLSIGPNGSIEVAGGSASQQPFATLRTAAADWPLPGGGGSGGSILLQLGGAYSQSGVLDVRGGAGGLTNFQSFFPVANVVLTGGDGGHGLLRVETPTPLSLSQLGQVLGPQALPMDTVGTLLDRDDRSTLVSRFERLSSGQPLDYRVDGTANGVAFTFTDAPGGTPANQPGQPVRVWLQGRRRLPNGDLEITPRRDRFADLVRDGATEVRFVIAFDQTVAVNTEVTRFELNLLR